MGSLRVIWIETLLSQCIPEQIHGLWRSSACLSASIRRLGLTSDAEADAVRRNFDSLAVSLAERHHLVKLSISAAKSEGFTFA